MLTSINVQLRHLCLCDAIRVRKWKGIAAQGRLAEEKEPTGHKLEEERKTLPAVQSRGKPAMQYHRLSTLTTTA